MCVTCTWSAGRPWSSHNRTCLHLGVPEEHFGMALEAHVEICGFDDRIVLMGESEILIII